MEAENQKTEYGREHQRRALICKQIEENLKHNEEKLQKFVNKSRSYFEEKALCHYQLNTQKQRIETLKQEINKAKHFYAQTLKNLEQISNEIHMKRGTKPDDEILKLPREPGVGASELGKSYLASILSLDDPTQGYSYFFHGNNTCLLITNV